MRTRRRDCAATLGGGKRREAVREDSDNAANIAFGRREFQGKSATQRAACQPAPAWPTPPGTAAALLLASRMRYWRRS